MTVSTTREPLNQDLADNTTAQNDVVTQDWHSQRVVYFEGAFDTHIGTGEDYETKTLAEIFDMAPANASKKTAPAFVPSSYNQYDARSHKAQREHGEYVALTGDIDSGNHDIVEIEDALDAILPPGTAWLVYSSSSATADKRKWRLIIPLLKPQAPAVWHACQLALIEAFAVHEIELDPVLARFGQYSVLPNVRPDKRKPDGTPLFFESKVVQGVGLQMGQTPVGFRAKEIYEEEQAEAERRQRVMSERAKTPRIAGGASPIEAFNSANTLAEIFAKYGYEQSPRNEADWRSPVQSSTSYATRDMGNGRWVSLSQSDTDAGIGAKTDAGCYGDAFDLYVHFGHGGDYKAALDALRPSTPDTDTGQAIADAGTPDDNHVMFAMDSKGGIPFNHHNAIEILTKYPEWRDVFAFDEFAQRKMVMQQIPGTHGNPDWFSPRELRDDDYISVLRWLNRNGYLRASKTIVCDVVDAACRERVISPVRHYLEDVGKDAEANPQSPDYLDNWAIEMLGIQPADDEQRAYIQQVSRKWLVSAVARALKPGCKADAVLILEGPQGIGKSTALRALAGDEWFGDALPPMGTKDASDYLRGKWIVEMAELSNINKAEVEVAKAFISRTEERFRPAYGRSEICYPRHCVFAGSTNKADYLRDETGNRRFWPVRCGTIDLKRIEAERDMLWGEAVRAYWAGEKWWLDGKAEAYAEVEQEKRLAADEWEGIITEWCVGKREVAISDIANGALQIEPRDINRQVQNRISAILTTIGYEKDGKFRAGGLRGKVRWVRNYSE